jgi:hypothetical protein
MGNTENPFSVKLGTNLEDALSSPLRFIFSIFSCIKKRKEDNSIHHCSCFQYYQLDEDIKALTRF